MHARATTRTAAATRPLRSAGRALRDGLAGVPGWSWCWRHRRALTPPLTVGLVWLAGCLAYALPWQAAMPLAAGLLVAGVVAFAAFVADAVGRRGFLTWWAMLWWLFVALAAAPWSRLALAVGVVLAVPQLLSWWWHLSRPAKALVGVAPEVLRWSTHLAGEKQALEGSRVVKAAALPAPGGTGTVGFRLIVQLPPGKLTLADVRKATPRIASAYGVDVMAVTVEHVATRDASAAMVTIMERSPLHTVQPWPGPRLDKTSGTFPVGVHEDGKPAVWQLWRPKSGAVHGLIAGTTGSGKSGTSNVILAEAALSGIVATFLIDPKGGQSLPEWAHHLPTDRVARTDTEWDAMLAGLIRVMEARARHLAGMEYVVKGTVRVGLARFDPTDPHGMPLILLFVDEAFTVLQKGAPAVASLELLATKARSVGIIIVFATQVPSVKSLGDSGTLRAMVASGQILVLRTSDKVSSGMLPMPNLPIDPSEIPADHPGMGFLSTRPAAMRGLWVEDPWEVASTAPVVALDPISAAAYAGAVPGDVVPPAPTVPSPVPSGLRGCAALIVEHIALWGPATRVDLYPAIPYSDRMIRESVKSLVASGVLVEGPGKRLALPAGGEAAEGSV